MAFSMGFSCGGTMALRKAQLQFASYPLDWIGAPGIVQSARMIEGEFANWFAKEDLQLVAVRGGSFQNNVYQNRRTRFGFPHDFPRFFRFEEIYQKTADKYARRVTRFMRQLGAAKTALAVYVERPINPRARDADLMEARRILSAKFPGAKFDLVYFFLERGRSGFAETAVADGVVAVGCDYAQLDHGEISHAIDWDVQYRYLKERFVVEDRRSETEKRAYSSEKRKDRRAKFGGKLNEIKYRIYRKLEKDLQERGLVPRDFPLWFD